MPVLEKSFCLVSMLGFTECSSVVQIFSSLSLVS